MFTRFLPALTIISVLSLESFAEGNKKRYEPSYGMAGCGLWSKVITGKDQSSQLGVWALRNFVLNSQTTAISSQLTNCVGDAPGYAKIEQEVFVEINLAELQKEASQGKGGHLYALSEVLGCKKPQVFAQLSQQKFKDIYSESNAKVVLSRYAKEIKLHQDLDCSRLI